MEGWALWMVCNRTGTGTNMTPLTNLLNCACKNAKTQLRSPFRTWSSVVRWAFDFKRKLHEFNLYSTIYTAWVPKPEIQTINTKPYNVGFDHSPFQQHNNHFKSSKSIPSCRGILGDGSLLLLWISGYTDQRIIEEAIRNLLASSEKVKRIIKAISPFIFKDLHPFSIVENEGPLLGPFHWSAGTPLPS